jgi:DNA-directed RNA polymerase sigma subunit (sigma70/sigma32)
MKKNTLERNKAIVAEFGRGVSEADIAVNHRVGFTYVRTLLRNEGLIKAKGSKTEPRDKEVRRLFSENQKTVPELAEQFGITPTRVRQIIKDISGEKLQKDLDDARQKALDLIDAGKTHQEVVDAIGEQTAKRLKYRYKFNIFQLVLKKRTEYAQRVYKEGTPVADIAAKLNCTPDYVYILLRDAGVKMKISKEEKRERDSQIYEYVKSKSDSNRLTKEVVADAAEKWSLTSTMIRIICSQMRKREIAQSKI